MSVEASAEKELAEEPVSYAAVEGRLDPLQRMAHERSTDVAVREVWVTELQAFQT